MSIREFCVFLGLFVIVCGQAPEVAPGECQYTFTVTGDALRDSCKTTEIQQLTSELRQQYDAVKQDNDALKAEVESLRDEYQSMVDSVKQLETETQSWREVFEWPKIEMPFEPDNASLIIQGEPSFKDCNAAVGSSGKAGIYAIKPENTVVPHFGFCDAEGWNVIQRRFDGEVDFYQDWDDYIRGFGQLSGEFWLGLENIYTITSQGKYEFRVEVLGWNGKLYHQNYDDFSVLSEDDDYKLQVGNMSAGNMNDVMTSLDGLGFSTHDHDQDTWHAANCAEYYHGGFWLTNCGFDPNRYYCDGNGCLSWGEKIIQKSVLKIRPMQGGDHDTAYDSHGETGRVNENENVEEDEEEEGPFRWAEAETGRWGDDDEDDEGGEEDGDDDDLWGARRSKRSKFP